MRFIQQFIHLSVLFLFITPSIYSTDFYVNKNATGQNNGTSWANAWQSFSAINWNSIQPGDVINISGGTDSTVYYETLNINDAGTANNYITIRGAIDAGHNGKVIIDAQNTRSHCILIEQGCGSLVRNWIYVKNLYLRRAADEAFYIHCNVNNVVIDGLDIRENGLEGIKIIGNDDYYLTENGICAEDIEIKNCTIVSKSNNLYHEDNCVYAQMVAGLKIHHNFIHQQNKQIGVPVGSHEHVDPLQTHVIRDVKIYNNVMVIDSSVLGHGMILGIQSRPGELDTVIIYNNYIYAGGHLNAGGDPYINGFVLRWYGYSGSVYPPTYVINNTVVTSNGGENTILQEYAGEFYNNIICQFGTNGQNPSNYGGLGLEAFASSWDLDKTYINKCLGNLMWNQWTNNMTFGGNQWVNTSGNTVSLSNWNSWISNGGTGINANPQFANNYRLKNGYVLKSTSPARNIGVNMKTFVESKGLPWTDIEGNPRDSSPDLGAYEYTTGGGNNPPNQPSNPNPVNGATNQQINITLTWSCSDPDGNPLTYDVYFGTNNNPPLISSNQSAASFNPGLLNNNTSYYWKIVAKDNQGLTTSGPVWNFATVAAIVNNPPYPPSNPNPGNGTTNQSINTLLTWSCTDPDGNPITYDVYFGTIDEPSLISTNHSNPSFNPGMLNSNTTYYWKIVARDNQGATTSGLVWNFSTVYLDQTPPQIANVELLDSVTLKIWFSEPVQQSEAQNISNYSINNGIQVLSASLSGSEVTLYTTEHASGTYTITVINVKDLAGNQISPPNNTDQYEYSPNPTQNINLELKIFLDGPYINNSMTTGLSNNSLVPFNQPYSGSPWNYYGNESVSGLPQNTVDWILLELRTNTSASSLVSRRAAFLRSDGIIVDLNGNNQILFTGVQSGAYYVVVYHRNHLAIMSKTPIQLSETSSLYDFTNSQNKAYGTQPMKSLGGGNYGLYAADGNANGNVNNSDNSSIWRPENGSVGYKKGDFDLNGGVNIVDKNDKWKINKGRTSYVPTN